MNCPYKGMKREDIIKINPKWKNCGFKKGNKLRTGKKDSFETRKRKSLARIGKNNPMFNKKGELCPHFGKKRPDQSKFMKENHPTKNINVRNKIRLSTINYIKKTRGSVSPNRGRNETKILDEIAMHLGYKIIRQYFVNGYFVDGYDKEKNIVFEVDERPKINERDIRRENEIKQELNCRFIRIKDY